MKKRRSQQQFPVLVFFTELYLHVTRKPSFKILNTNKFKNIKKKPSCHFEAQVKHSFTKQVKGTQPIDDWRIGIKMCYRKREISATPIQFHLKELYCGCHSSFWIPKQKAVSYAGETFGCSTNLFLKSWWLVLSELLASSLAGSPLNSTDRRYVLKEK